jgi:PAS domain S-box-containing protein
MVLENSLDAAYRRNLHTNRYDYLSPVIEKLTGYTAEEFMSLDLETVLGMMHPLDRIGVRQELERGLAHEPSRKLEYRLKTRTGEYRWFSDNFNILGDEHGTPRYLVGTVRDITDRKQSEMALQMSEERFRKLLETAEEGIWIFDPKGIITFTNEALASMLGYSREELIGKSVFDLLHKEQWKLERQIAVRRRADQGARYDLHYTRRDGNELWATVVESRIRDDDGNSIGSIALFTDITERKRAEQAQAFSERRYRLALDSIPDMIMIFDRKMNLQYLNLAMRRQVGFTGTEFKSVSLREVWPEMHGILQPCLAASAETGAMQTADGAMNGTEKGQLVHATCIPVDENGIIREIIAIIHLVT